jgi:hypothetical protein
MPSYSSHFLHWNTHFAIEVGTDIRPLQSASESWLEGVRFLMGISSAALWVPVELPSIRTELEKWGNLRICH